ncbi:MAG: hypothetical protein ACYC27_00425 [Armatimonadota bacterium]
MQNISRILLISIAGVISFAILQLLSSILFMIMGLSNDETSILLGMIISIATVIINAFIMGYVMQRYTSCKSGYLAFATGLVMAFAISSLNTLIISVIPHKGVNPDTSSGSYSILYISQIILWHLGQAAVFLLAFRIAGKRQISATQAAK